MMNSLYEPTNYLWLFFNQPIVSDINLIPIKSKLVMINIISEKILFNGINFQLQIAIYALIAHAEIWELKANYDNIINHLNIYILSIIFFILIKIYRNIIEICFIFNEIIIYLYLKYF